MNYKYSIIIAITILSGLTLTALGHHIFTPKKTFKEEKIDDEQLKEEKIDDGQLKEE
jgi:hypothetical protein